MLDSLPPQFDERVTCSIEAARKYEIPANVVLAIAEKENGLPGQWVRNKNSTHDVGPLQFNTAYLATLARYRIRPADVAAPGCYPYELAAWRLRQHLLNDVGDLWRRLANYHSRTERFNEIYRADLMRRAAKWADWLAARNSTHELQSEDARFVTSPGRSSNTEKTTASDGAPSAGLTGTQSAGYGARGQALIGRTPIYVPRQLLNLTK